MEHYGRVRVRSSKQGKTEEEATEYLRQLFTHVPVQDKSARESLATFSGGKGDVLIGYENEAITAQQNGEDFEFVVPDQTILIENPIAVVTESANPEKAQAFIDFLRTPDAQRVFGEKGYRSILPEVLAEFPDFAKPDEALHDRRSRWLAGCDDEVLRSRQRYRGQSRSSSECNHLSPRRGSSRANPAPHGAQSGRRHAVSAGRGHALSQRHGADPAGGGRCPLHAGGAGGFRPGRHRAAVPGCLVAEHSAPRLVALVNAVVGTLIAWVLVRDTFRGKEVVNALIDLPFALPTIVAGLTLIALYGARSPHRAQHCLHPAGRHPGAAVRHPAVRRAHRAAGAGRN